MGHAMNKVLKDVIVRTQQMMGKDAPYVPGWDCHGLPIEWKIEEKYRKKGKNKDEVPSSEFRQECRDFASHWIGVQRDEFKRLGIFGDWENPYTTMAFPAEAQIVRELMKFVDNGSLYRGSKPVMWSVVEKTALAEAEVEYEDITSTQIDVAFPIEACPVADLIGAKAVIWTTTPWTIPVNQALAYGADVDYVALQDATGAKYLVANLLKDAFAERAGLEGVSVVWEGKGRDLAGTECAHPWKGKSEFFDRPRPFLEGDFVTIDQGTGLVHMSPDHGEDDFYLCQKHGIDPVFVVQADGFYREDWPIVGGVHLFKVSGKPGENTGLVCDALAESDGLLSSGDLLHSYPHSWRSKAKLIYRCTAQWFISMAKNDLREKALNAIEDVKWIPAQSKNRIRAMVADRPDWVISRQRAWGVPITIFVHKDTGEILNDPAVNARIVEAVEKGGADEWFQHDIAFFLGEDYDASAYEKVDDILDVWFDSGCTHAFVVEGRDELGDGPAQLYLEGTDQHRGWFQSSLMESCGTRGRAPYEAVLTHGFAQDKDGRKMSKSLNNSVYPQDITKQHGADILRLWVVATNYFDDVRIGSEILKGQVDAYRKIRNTMRFMLGNLAGFDESERVEVADMPELERWVLSRLSRLDDLVREKSNNYDLNPIYQALYNFCIVDLSSFYFDIRKDSLYCDAASSMRRRAARTVLDHVFHALTKWLAPILVFTAEEVWQARFPDANDSVHLQQFADVPNAWRDEALEEKWSKVRNLRRVVNGALELERREKRIGSSLQSAPKVYVDDAAYLDAFKGVDLADIVITSGGSIEKATAPEGAFTLDDVQGVAVVPEMAQGDKCQRCWMVLPDVGANETYDDLCPRCADAVDAAGGLPQE